MPEIEKIIRDEYDIIVAGAGNAALSAAIAARDAGASVLVLEKAPMAARGGNSYFTGGIFKKRTYYTFFYLSMLIVGVTGSKTNTA